MNKRSGKLTLEQGNERGEIVVVDGRPVNAPVGRAEGEKALFRLLVWSEGSFTFSPGNTGGKPRIQRAVDDALLEAMRQADEVNRLLPGLPARNVRLVLAPEADLTQDQHPVTAQVVELLRQPRALGEVLDLAPATDLEVVGVLHTLLRHPVPAELHGAPAGAASMGEELTKALRGLLLLALNPAPMLPGVPQTQVQRTAV